MIDRIRVEPGGQGLFEVTEGIYQVRGYDLANMTFVAGDTGWIVIDPLTAKQTAAAALQLANDELGERPVVAVIYTHSHADHFGGAHGVIDAAGVSATLKLSLEIVRPAGWITKVGWGREPLGFFEPGIFGLVAVAAGMARHARRTLTFSSRTASGVKSTGASMATRQRSCRR